MRLLSVSLVFVAALFTITACSGKSSSSSDQSDASAQASTSAEASGAGNMAAATTAPASGEAPKYPGAVTQASGSGSNMGTTATGTVMSTDDSFDKVYQWYQQNMPAGSEKSHVTAPVQSAVFTMGDTSSGQTSVTITTQGGKTMITIGKVKM